MWPWNASTQGHLYIFHFNAPLGNLANARAQASHYCGFAEDLDSRLAKQLAGRGAKLVAAALKQGLVFEIYHWPACLATEKLVKRTKKTALYCPACAAAAGRRPRPLPTPPPHQLAFDLDEQLPTIELGRMDWLELKINQEWRAVRIPAPSGLEAIDELL
jgi:predicted GIY-YIG superfamily endonuclease